MRDYSIEQAVTLFKGYVSEELIRKKLVGNNYITFSDLEIMKEWFDKNSHNFYGAPDGMDPEFYFEEQIYDLNKIKTIAEMFKDYVSEDLVKNKLCNDIFITPSRLKPLKEWFDENRNNFHYGSGGMNPEICFNSKIDSLIKSLLHGPFLFSQSKEASHEGETDSADKPCFTPN